MFLPCSSIPIILLNALDRSDSQTNKQNNVCGSLRLLRLFFFFFPAAAAAAAVGGGLRLRRRRIGFVGETGSADLGYYEHDQQLQQRDSDRRPQRGEFGQ